MGNKPHYNTLLQVALVCIASVVDSRKAENQISKGKRNSGKNRLRQVKKQRKNKKRNRKPTITNDDDDDEQSEIEEGRIKKPKRKDKNNKLGRNIDTKQKKKKKKKKKKNKGKDCMCGEAAGGNPTEKIIGGTDVAKPTDYPWQVGLIFYLFFTFYVEFFTLILAEH